MRFLYGFLLLVVVVPSCLVAQTTEIDLKARLTRAPLYLRGQWSSDSLTFDNAGKQNGTSAAGPFTLSGVDVQSVKLTSKALLLEGQRVGLEFQGDAPRRVGLVLRGKFTGTKPEKMTLTIERPANGDFKAPLDAIFADNIADLVPGLPEYWQTYAQKHLLPSEEPPVPADGGLSTTSGVVKLQGGTLGAKRVGGSVSAPQLLTRVDPDFDEAARALKYSGIVLVSLVVDPTGVPRRVRILHPTGMGLDEQAVAAVEQYTFKPAIEDGKPVAAELNVEVNFQIF